MILGFSAVVVLRAVADHEMEEVHAHEVHGENKCRCSAESESVHKKELDSAMVAVAGNIIQRKDVELIPILQPYQNVHDLCKQLVLLEAHLFDSERNCPDCQNKHMLTCQALCEEAISLVTVDPDRSLPVPTDLQSIGQQIRALHIELEDSDRSPAVRHRIGRSLRQIRKPLMKHYGRPLVA